MREQLRAVVWDFDGTLVDTREKNLNVTRALVELVKQRPAEDFEALRSLGHYERALQQHHTWREFYRLELRMSDAEVLDAGSRWMSFQLQDRTVAASFDGVPAVLRALAPVPQGIVSLNARPNILRFLEELGLDGVFAEVLGYEAVELHRQKPEPDALIMCIDRLTALRPGRVLFIGDHEVDVQCAHNANEQLARDGVAVEVISVGALYGPRSDDSSWQSQPHFRVRHPQEILGLVDGPVASPA